jgi:threonine synthase
MAALHHVMVRVPATSANLGPAFDCAGLALDLFATFDFERLPDDAASPDIHMHSSWGEEPALAHVPANGDHLAYRAFAGHLVALGQPVPSVRIRVDVGMPLSRGLGSSAAAVVAGILAAEAFAGQEDSPRRRAALIDAAAALEHGHHPDNVAAALLGGLAVVARDHASGGFRAVRLPVPTDLRAVVFVPSFAMDTVAGRCLLPETYSRHDAAHNLSHVALLMAALAAGDPEALRVAMDDRFHEPFRVQIFPQMPDLLAAARSAGAYGACLSGGGSSILAFAAPDRAPEVAMALAHTGIALGIEGRAIIVRIDQRGAEIQIDAPATTGVHFTCECGATDANLRRFEYRCDACGQPLDVALGDAGFDRDGIAWRRLFDDRLRSLAPEDRSGVWRFREILLSLPEILPVTRPEGATNLYPAGRTQDAGGHGAIGAFAGVDRLWLKHEGEEPTGSFKDRGMTMAVSVARWLGASAVACASTGNTSASMAAYAAQAGMTPIVLLPEGKVAAGKLGQAIAYGAEIRQIAGDFDAAMREVEILCRDQGIYLLNSLNPFRILGQQSLAFELAQQFAWDVPDWIALPAGNLGNTSALGAGLLRAFALGMITRLPRIAAIQAAGANPFYQSYQQDFAVLPEVQAHTIATAINIGRPVSFARARNVIRATNGVVAEVTDDEILQAKAIIDRAGIGCEPASAASVAGVRQLVARGIIQSHERVVAVLTGNVLKDPDSILLARRVAGDLPDLALAGEAH